MRVLHMYAPNCGFAYLFTHACRLNFNHLYVIRAHSRNTCPQTVSVHIPVLIHLPLHIPTLTHVHVYTYPNEYMLTLVYAHT